MRPSPRALLRAAALAATAALIATASAPAHAGSPVKDDEMVVLYVTTAHRDGDSWVVPVHGWIGELEPDSVWRGMFEKSLLTGIGRAPTDAEAIVLKSRLQWFLADGERGKKIELDVGGQRVTLPRSGKDGRFKGELRVPRRAATGDRLAIATSARDGRRFAGTVALVEGDGLAVISDLDDTIKDTNVLVRRVMMQRTFLEPFAPVAGMAGLYAGWSARGVPFFYVSGSPWQLYVPLRDFLASGGFPPGELFLRAFRVKDDSRLALLAAPDKHKLGAIRSILRRFPERRFVLVGDGGERDPEIYGVIAREAPRRIERILIRKVPGDSLDQRRWTKALGSAAGKAILFRDPGELPDDVSQLGAVSADLTQGTTR